MSERDILSEATSWLTHMRPENPLIPALKGVSNETLEVSYLIWWDVYSGEIRKAPSNRPGQGVNAGDAAHAGTLANRYVLDYLRGVSLSQETEYDDSH